MPPVHDLAATAAPDLLVQEGIVHQAAGRIREAGDCFAMAVDAGGNADAALHRAEALRRLGIVHHLHGETQAGLTYCTRSRDLAIEIGSNRLAGEATMAMANMSAEQGDMTAARERYRAALALAPDDPSLHARIEQNLGILENIQGNTAAALAHHRRALAAYEASGNLAGRAMVHHNIGKIRADQRDWLAAHGSYQEAAALARRAGNWHLEGLCLLNHAEVDLANDRFDEVRRQAEAAATIFERLGARVDHADAFRMLGVAYRFLHRPTLAESRLQSAVEMATSAGSALAEAECCRDLALLYAESDRTTEALALIDRALGLFNRIGAVRDSALLTARREKLVAA